jgi:hypothetical protein
MDSNIDTFNSKHNKTWNVKNFKMILFDFLNKSNVTVRNNKITHFSKVHDDSCIDHIFTIVRMVKSGQNFGLKFSLVLGH